LGFGLAGLLLVTVVGAVALGRYLPARQHLRQAEQAAGRFDFPLALAHVEASLELWPAGPDAYLLAARAARRGGNYPEAGRYLRACEKLQGAPSDVVLLERLLLEAEVGTMSGSTEHFLVSCVREDPKDAPLILEALAGGYVEQHRLPTAEQCLEECLRREPANARALLLRGTIKDKLNLPGEAVEFYRRVVDAYPEHGEGRLRWAESLLNSGETEAALAQFEVLARGRPTDPAVCLGLARCRAEQGAMTEACRMLEALLAQDSRNKAALSERGRLALATDHAGDAERWLRLALALDPSDRRSNYLLYLALKQQGKDAEAEAQKAQSDRVMADLRRLGVILSEEMDRRPNDPSLLCELGTLYLRNGQEELAAHWLAKALELDPNHGPARQAVAEYYERTGKVSGPRGSGSEP
jgi:tetratricopeptide (TPR) repeat protein